MVSFEDVQEIDVFHLPYVFPFYSYLVCERTYVYMPSILLPCSVPSASVYNIKFQLLSFEDFERFVLFYLHLLSPSFPLRPFKLRI